MVVLAQTVGPVILSNDFLTSLDLRFESSNFLSSPELGSKSLSLLTLN